MEAYRKDFGIAAEEKRKGEGEEVTVRLYEVAGGVVLSSVV